MCSFNCCAIYSATGVLFLLFVYTLLSTQPFFVNGVENVDSAKASALGAVVLFVVLFFISVAGIFRSSRNHVAEEGMMIFNGRSSNSNRGLNINLDYLIGGTSPSLSY